MKLKEIVLFICFAWSPVLMVSAFGASAGAQPTSFVQKTQLSGDKVSFCAGEETMRRRFSPARYSYPSDRLGREVRLLHGAYAGRDGLTAAETPGGQHEILVSAYDQGDLDGDGCDEAILLVEESVCSGETCNTVRHLDVWTYRAGDVIRQGRIPISLHMELDSVGIQIRKNAIQLSMVDLDGDGELREVFETWQVKKHAPVLVRSRVGDVVEDFDSGC